ncbi:MAG: polysaccharide biosynthesis/export family protein [Myxococcota bacterium]
MSLSGTWAGLVGGVLLAVATCGPEPVTVVPPPALRAKPELGPGDLVEIRVTDQEELSGEYEVSEDGTIRFPWIEDVEVVGQTQGELARSIEAKLADGWLRQPQVSVKVVSRQNREVSVLGQVNAPGSYPFKERLTLVQAISLAGGMNPLAHTKRIKLIRETDGGRQTYEIDVRKILESKREDLPLLPGDVIFVPEAPI